MELVTQPKIVAYIGPMFSEKTTKLICALRRASRRGQGTLACKARLDTRYSKSQITTHDGISHECTAVSNGMELDNAILDSPATIIGIDELFLIDGATDIILKHFRLGKSFYISSIQLSASGNPFEEVTKLLPFATDIVICQAICSICGADAAYTARKITDLDEIAVGGEDLYEPRCYGHFTDW